MPRSAVTAPVLRAAALALALAGCHESASPPGKLELVDAPASVDPAPWIRSQLAAHQGRQMIVYVGASWCEPCQHFHQAAVAGELDAAFPDLTILVFDQDRDGDGLERAGYTSRLVPLFVRPDRDGTASGKSIEGSIKGDGAVAQIIPRLKELLARQ